MTRRIPRPVYVPSPSGEVDYGKRTTAVGLPCQYTPPGGETYTVYDVAFILGRIWRADLHHRPGSRGRPLHEATHRAFVNAKGVAVFANFTDRSERGSTEMILWRQIQRAVPREEIRYASPARWARLRAHAAAAGVRALARNPSDACKR